MTEQKNEYSYARKLQNTLSQNHIRKIAHNIMQLNKSRPGVVQENIRIIREQITGKKSGAFQVTIDKSKKLAELAAYARTTTAKKVGV